MSDLKTHAMLSPSGADRWMTCPGSIALTKDLPDTTSPASAEGTNYHELGAMCLEEGTNADEYIGHQFEDGVIITEENTAFVQEYVDAVRVYATQGTLLVEETVPIQQLTGEVDAQGTSDAVVLGTHRELIVVDLKFGYGKVAVEQNRQLMIYALGVLEKHQAVDDFDTARLVICQPRNGGTQEWVCSISELRAFGEEVTRTATQILTTLKLGEANAGARVSLPLVPSEKACHFCKARAICPALEKAVTEAATEGFADLEAIPIETSPGVMNRATAVGLAMNKVALVEIWAKAVRAASETELLAGREVMGYKLVQGRKGHRKFGEMAEAEAMMKRMRIKHHVMYDYSLATPTSMEKRLKDQPNAWRRLAELVTQSPGVPSVAHESDKRPALVVECVENRFVDLDAVLDATEFI